MPKPKQLYVHAISDKNWSGIHSVEKYEFRVIVSAPKDQENIYVFSEAPDEEYLAYRRDYLGYQIDQEQFFVASGHGRHLAERVLNDHPLVERLKGMLPQGSIMDTFTVGPAEERLAERMGMRLIGKTADANLGSKSNFRRLVKQSGFQVAPGHECLTSSLEVIGAAAELFDRGARRVVVKGDFGASSSQNQLFESDENWVEKVERFLDDISFSGGVVEEWIENVEISPSTHYQLNGRAVQQPGPWEQVLRGRNRVYAGATYPARVSQKLAREIKRQGLAIAGLFSDLGVEGALGFDCVVTNSGQIIWSEANVRKGGVTFIRDFAVVQNVIDRVIWGLDLVDERLMNMSFGEVLKKTKPLLFRSTDSDSQKEGVVFYNVGCLSKGKIQLIIVAKTVEEAQFYWTMLNRKMFDLL
ncbi:MAG: hypothetical protein ACOZBH_05040 [Patescibacteria group bacterium]